MRRGEIYRIAKPPGNDPKKHRFFVIVSRPALIDSRFQRYTVHDGLSTQVAVGITEGLKHASSIHCDALISIEKSRLTNYVGRLSTEKLQVLNDALAIALHLDLHSSLP